MARGFGRRVRGPYTKARLLAAVGVPSLLKLTLMGGGKHGGYVTIQERRRRKLPKMLKNTSSTRKIKALEEPGAGG